jgi:hypothetical protein
VRDFIPDDAGGYGYLAWRYSAAHRRAFPELSSRPSRCGAATSSRAM